MTAAADNSLSRHSAPDARDPQAPAIPAPPAALARNPALDAFIARVDPDLVLGQVLIQRADGGRFALRHHSDRDRAETALRHVPIEHLRKIADFTAAGVFRPLKSAPNLPSGWHALARNPLELERALQQLYPGALADLHAASEPPIPATDFEPFVQRQTGMYRIAARLTPRQAADVIRSCCAPRFCLKRRYWRSAALRPDDPQTKSLIPCLEPCAILLEFSRKAMRIEQDTIEVNLGAAHLASLAAAARAALDQADHTGREADFADPLNPRRLELALQKLDFLIGHTRRNSSEDQRD